MATNDKVTGWAGWVFFAGLMMTLIGVFQGIAGLTALLKDDFYAVTADKLVVFSYTTWGWVHLIVGLVVFAAGIAVINGSTWGRIVGVILALMSATANMVFLSAYPVWSIVMIVVDILIIYALIVHGDEVREK